MPLGDHDLMDLAVMALADFDGCSSRTTRNNWIKFLSTASLDWEDLNGSELASLVLIHETALAECRNISS